MKYILTIGLLFSVLANAYSQNEVTVKTFNQLTPDGKINCKDEHGNTIASYPASTVFGDKRIPTIADIASSVGVSSLSDLCRQQAVASQQMYHNTDQDAGNNEVLIVNQFCSHVEGWVEYVPGTCQAGGPPPICPFHHWYQDPNAMDKWVQEQKSLYAQRLQDAATAVQNCVAAEKAQAAANNTATASATPALAKKTFGGTAIDTNPTDTSKLSTSKGGSGQGGAGTPGLTCADISNAGGNLFVLYDQFNVSYSCGLALNSCVQCTGYGVNSYTATLIVSNNSNTRIFITLLDANYSDVGCTVSSLDCPSGTVNGFTSSMFDYRIGILPGFCFNCATPKGIPVDAGGTFTQSWDFSRKCAYTGPPNWGFDYSIDANPTVQQPAQVVPNPAANNAQSNSLPAGFKPKSNSTSGSNSTANNSSGNPAGLKSITSSSSSSNGYSGASSANTHTNGYPTGFKPKVGAAASPTTSPDVSHPAANGTQTNNLPAGFKPKVGTMVNSTSSTTVSHPATNAIQTNNLPAGFKPKATQTSISQSATNTATDGSQSSNLPVGKPKTNSISGSQSTSANVSRNSQSNNYPSGFTLKPGAVEQIKPSSTASNNSSSSYPAGFKPNTTATTGSQSTSGTTSGNSQSTSYPAGFTPKSNAGAGATGSQNAYNPSYPTPASAPDYDAQRQEQLAKEQEERQRAAAERQREAASNSTTPNSYSPPASNNYSAPASTSNYYEPREEPREERREEPREEPREERREEPREEPREERREEPREEPREERREEPREEPREERREEPQHEYRRPH